MAKPMKVRVPVLVEVDVEAWNREYGSNESRDDIRRAVMGMLGSAAADAFRNLMLGDDPSVLSVDYPL